MEKIPDIYINALLADGAYVDGLFDRMPPGDLFDALKERMTPTLAEFVSNNFEVVAHKESGDVLSTRGRTTV